ncbi:MAG: glutamate-cysteine ligase family protein [Halalkalicoccus sp.]|nr:glutamate-cysteine ligase family protein [Halalkalicoccus sp.]
MNVGIEVEYWVVDADGHLASAADLIDAHEYVVPEFVDSLVEIVLPPAGTPEELEAEFTEALTAVLDAAHAAGKRLVPLGIPLVEESPPVVSERGRILERIHGDRLRYAKNCAGTHIHFDAVDPIAQARLLTALDPALALVATAPYYGGRRTAASARAAAYRRGMGADFARFRALRPYLRSSEEHEDRTAECFAAFVDLATGADLDPALVTELFRPEDVCHGPVRIREDLGTVEWRAPDTALPSQVIRLAFDVAAILEASHAKPVVVGDEVGVHPERTVIPPFACLSDLVDEAIYTGLTPSIEAYLEAFGVDVSSYAPLTERFPTDERLSAAAARGFRLRAAELLERDAARLARTPVVPGPAARKTGFDDPGTGPTPGESVEQVGY